MPKTTRSKLVAKADKVFSEYIRTGMLMSVGMCPVSRAERLITGSLKIVVIL